MCVCMRVCGIEVKMCTRICGMKVRVELYVGGSDSV